MPRKNRHRSNSGGSVLGGTVGVILEGDENLEGSLSDLKLDEDSLPTSRSCSTTLCCLHEADEEGNEYDSDTVRVTCSNDMCQEPNWMHADCFHRWEENIANFLIQNRYVRDKSSRQIMQQLWNSRDLPLRANTCKCQKGYLKKENDARDAWKQRQRRNRPSRPMVSHYVPTAGSPYANREMQQQSQAMQVVGFRQRTSSLTSTGSSPRSGSSLDSPTSPPHLLSSSASSSATNPGDLTSFVGSSSPHPGSTFASFSGASSSGGSFKTGGGPPFSVSPSQCVAAVEKTQAATGSIFHRRLDIDIFNALPRHKRNSYHIKMEDDGPHGNDETRCFVLASLSKQRITHVSCVVCDRRLNVYDKYPLVDGTFYLTPLPYKSAIAVRFEGRQQMLNAVCLWCLETGCDIQCKLCSTRWDGTTLRIGAMYAYDIFAATPCCQSRLQCNHCHTILQNPVGSDGNCYYSTYSRQAVCSNPHCKKEDFHFVKPLTDIFKIRQSIWNN